MVVNRRRRRRRRSRHHEALLADPAVQAGTAAVRAALEPAGPLVPQAFAAVDPEELSVVFRRMGAGDRTRFLVCADPRAAVASLRALGALAPWASGWRAEPVLAAAWQTAGITVPVAEPGA